MPGNDSIAATRTAPTKSCAECRRRKIRCRWPTNSNEPNQAQETRFSCANCIARGKRCFPQLNSSHSPSEPHATARSRITQLESQVAELAALVKDNHSKGSHQKDQANLESSTFTTVAETGYNASSSATVTSSEPSLRLLSDSHIHARNTRLRLRSVLPNKDDVGKIATLTSKWNSSYYSLFSTWPCLHTGDEITSLYDRIHNDPDVPPTAIGNYLQSLAITVHQVPSEDHRLLCFEAIKVKTFVNDVAQAVEETIVSSNIVAATLEGLETVLGLVTLRMGQGSFENTWLTLRRAIALAELLGLPQVAKTLTQPTGGFGSFSPDNEALDRKVRLWNAICATDCITSVMLNLPRGITGCAFSLSRPINQDEGVGAQAYIYQLSNICSRVHDLDKSFEQGGTEIANYEQVLRIDREMRSLSVLPPASWWQYYESFPEPQQLAQFWHYYFLARIHIRCALSDDVKNQYNHSRQACYESCQNALIRFVALGRLFDSESIIWQVIYTSAFTAASFLLLLSHSPRGEQEIQDDLRSLYLIHQTMVAFKSTQSETRAIFADDAIAALTSIHERFAQGDGVQGSNASLRIPFLGNISFKRAALPLGFGDTRVDSTPWSFEVDIGQSWLQNFSFNEHSIALVI